MFGGLLQFAANHELVERATDLIGDFGREVGIGWHDVVENPVQGLIAAAVLTCLGLWMRYG